jgi:type IV secretion system protein VirB4
MKTTTQLQQIAREETPLADHLPFGSMVAPGVVRLRGGRGYLKVWRLDGIAFETADAGYIQERKEALHHFIRSLGGGKFALWTHKVRRVVRERLAGSYDNAFARAFNERYYASFDLRDSRTGEPLHRQMVTELYMSVIYRPSPSLSASVLRKMTGRSMRTIRERLESALTVMEDLDRQLLTSLRRYGPEPLGTYTRLGKIHSETAAFLGFLVNGVWEEMPLKDGELAEYLPASRPLFGDQNGLVEIWHPKEHKFAGFLDLQDYPKRSEPGMNNAILYSDYEYIETQSFSMLNKHDALDALDRQKGHLVASEDASESEVLEMDRAREQVSSGEIEMGEYHYTLNVFGASLAEVARNMADARTALQDGPGFKVSVVDAIPECAWLSQLPGNWHMRPREAILSSRNFTSLSPLHNFAQGKRLGNPWGESLALMQTPSCQPYYLNHHVSPEDHDATDEKKPGNTIVIGQTGVGKTALVCGLMLFALKYAGLRGVFFDKDRGAEICIRRLGGRYSAFKRGEPTGLNPCQLPLTETNIAFCEQLVRLLAGAASLAHAAAEDAEISHAVRTVMSDAMPPHLRRLSAVWQNLKVSPGGNSLRDRLQKWTGNGPLGWAFDNPRHTHDFSDPGIAIHGYDYTEFLEDAGLRTPTVAMLLHMTESLIDGRPFIYWMEEFWKALSDPYFSKFAHNKQKTIRKLNGLGVFITQSPSDALTHTIGKTIVEQSVTQIYLPNPSADHDDYVHGFKVTEQEFTIIRHLGEDSRLFLLKQGHRSAILRYDLSSMPDMLNILSGSLDNVELLDAIRSEVGDDPEVWEPVLQTRIAARREAIKHQ